MIPVIFAQALAEKGALDGAVTGISAFFSNISTTVQERPLVFLVILAVVLALLLKRKG